MIIIYMFVLTKKSLISITAAIPKGHAIHITPGNLQGGWQMLINVLPRITWYNSSMRSAIRHRDLIAKAHK